MDYLKSQKYLFSKLQMSVEESFFFFFKCLKNPSLLYYFFLSIFFVEVQNLLVGMNFAVPKLLGEWEYSSSPGEAESCRQCVVVVITIFF